MLMKLEFSLQIASSMKIRPGERSCSTWADGRTSMKKLVVAFRNFANPPKNSSFERTDVLTDISCGFTLFPEQYVEVSHCLFIPYVSTHNS